MLKERRRGNLILWQDPRMNVEVKALSRGGAARRHGLLGGRSLECSWNWLPHRYRIELFFSTRKLRTLKTNHKRKLHIKFSVPSTLWVSWSPCQQGYLTSWSKWMRKDTFGKCHDFQLEIQCGECESGRQRRQGVIYMEAFRVRNFYRNILVRVKKM